MRKLPILTLCGVLFAPMIGLAKADQVLYCEDKAVIGSSIYEDGEIEPMEMTKNKYKVRFYQNFSTMKLYDDEDKYKCEKSLLDGVDIMCQRVEKMGLRKFLYTKQTKRFVFWEFVDARFSATSSGTCQKF